MKPLALVLTCGAALLARTAIAHACGGGSDGGGSSSGSSGGGDSGGYYSSDDSSTAVPACVDASDVHGYRTCSDYGAGWGQMAGLPAVSFELATWAAQVDLADVEVGGHISHSYGADYQYRVVGDDLGNEALAMGIKGRILGHGKRLGGGTNLYGGVESGIAALGGAGSTVQTREMADGTAMLTPRATMTFVAGGVLGVEHGSGRLTLGGELMGGLRGVTVSAESQRGACITTETATALAGVVEGRVRADVWLTPWVTLGAYAGRDLFSGTTSGGVGIGGHLRAFDGTR